MGGSMGAAVGEGIVAAARLAVLQDAPLIVFTASGGARMQEGTYQPDADAAHRHRRRAWSRRPGCPTSSC